MGGRVEGRDVAIQQQPAVSVGTVGGEDGGFEGAQAAGGRVDHFRVGDEEAAVVGVAVAAHGRGEALPQVGARARLAL